MQGFGVWRRALRRAQTFGTLWLLAQLLLVPDHARADLREVAVTYLERQVEREPVLYNLAREATDEGLAGARLGLADNATSGRFLGLAYRLDTRKVAPGEDWLAAARETLKGGARLLIVNAPADDLLALADLPDARDAILFNAGAPDTRLRDGDCRANILHTLASRDMLADALAQYLTRRKWGNALLIEGPSPQDKLWAQALRASLKKFGGRIVAEKAWSESGDLRRNAAAEVPLLTQARDYDVVLVADEAEDFARYVVANTWLPRPVAGSAGLRAAAWAPVVEQWGAVQLQNRFQDKAGRTMTPVDYAAWAAMRTVGEASLRASDLTPAALGARMRAPDFALAGFKGAKLSFRSWNGQLRQPIPIVHPEALVAYAPLEGFLHQRTELDTLGLDQPESRCKLESRK
jgi:ABC transporter substrate binding protein (PQQ-dependent alcohol dehydrogenase system)